MPWWSMIIASISLRPLVPLGLRTIHAVRCSTSPSAMPPNVVLIRSFSDARLFSKKYSHVPLPSAAMALDSQNVKPLARPPVK